MTTKPLIDGAYAGQIFISGWQKAHGGKVTVTEKATGEHLFESGLADAIDVEAAAAAAAAAQQAWGATPGPLRGDVIRKFAALIEQHVPEIREWIIRETGSIPPKGDFEIFTTVREAVEVAALGSLPVGQILASTAARPSYARRVPLGVVGVITPWNSPFILAARAVLPARVAGNAVLLKPDVQTPVCGGLLLARLFELAGLPSGVLQVVPGGADTGEAIVKSPQVQMISFTGSTAVGRHIGQIGGGLLKRVALELGGNNALLVFDDADLERATSAAAFGSFFHQGQICFSAGRHLVQESVAKRYTEMLAKRADALHVGDPFRGQVHLGPVINQKQADRAKKIMLDSIEQGARVEAGAKVDGLYFRPTVLSGVTPDMPVFTDEIFGPVAPVVTFRDEEEAIALANRTEYGLVASIFTANQARAMRVASQLRTGIVHINDQTVNHEVYGPIGGMGASGNGARSGNVTSLDEFSQWQWITLAETVPAYPF